MPLQNSLDHMYIMNWCPKLFVLYVLKCTVSKLPFGDSFVFPFKRFYCRDSECLDRPLGKTGILTVDCTRMFWSDTSS